MTIQVGYDNALVSGGFVTDAIGRLSSTSSAGLYNRNREQRLQLLDIRTRAWQDFNMRFLALKKAAESVQSDDTWLLTSASTSSSAFSAQTAGSAVPGTYAVRVHQLAQPHVIASGTVSDTFAPLNLAGTFTADDLTIEVFAGDSLRDIATSLNAVNNATAVSDEAPAHVSAGGTITVNDRTIAIGAGSSLLDIRDTVNAAPLLGASAAVVQDRLFLAMDDGSGIAIGDVTGSVLSDLGLMDSGSRTDTPPGIDLAALIEDNARMLLARQGTNNEIRLEMGNKVLQDLGFLAADRTFANEVTAAQGARITVDGNTFASDSNAVTGAIAGVTLNLADVNTYAQRLTVATDTSAAFTAIENLVTQYNNVMGELNANAGYQGAFFMDRDVWDIRNELITNLTTPLAGRPDTMNEAAEVGLNVKEKPANVVTGFNLIAPVADMAPKSDDTTWAYENDESLLQLSDIGIIYDTELGTLAFDAARLAATLETGTADVQALFSHPDGNFASRIADQADILVDPTSGTIQKEVQVVENIKDDLEKSGSDAIKQSYDFQREEYLALLTVKQMMGSQFSFFSEKTGIFS